MKASQRKILSLFFILLGVSPHLLIFTFILKEQQIRHVMEEKMEKSVLQTLILDEAEVVWMKPSKEILVDGKLFDIKNTEKKDGKIIFLGLYDEEETELKKNMKKQQPAEKNLLSSFFSMIFGLYNNHSETTIINFNHRTKKNPGIIQHWLQPFLTILTPPPQNCI